MKTSIIIPAFNERATIGRVVRAAAALPIDKEIIVVDDCSTDGTRDIIRGLHDAGTVVGIFQPQNGGKGTALRSGIAHATGDVVVVQDADLEVSPDIIPRLVQPIADGRADVVYGSRFLRQPWQWRRGELANRFLTLLTNLLYGAHITDMETAHKAMRRSVAQDLGLTARRFDFEPEVTAKLLRRGYEIHEMPNDYRPRDKAAGKKIGWRDGVEAILTLLRCRLLRS